MAALYIGLALIAAISGIVCTVIILIDMFQDSIVKGLFGIICGLYALYYAIFEFDHEHKWLVILVAFGGSAIATGFATMASNAMG